MSKTFNMVGGGGGKAALAVAVTNGTATSVTATRSGVSVSLTYSGGIWSAVLPSFGTWNVTITDGTHSNSATVNASTAGLYKVSIFMPDVPSAYTQLEYLQSSGTQYIDTGTIPDAFTIARITFQQIEISTGGNHYNNIFSARNASTYANLYGINTRSVGGGSTFDMNFQYGSGATVCGRYTSNDVLNVRTKNNQVSVNGTDYQISTSFSGSANSIILFGTHNATPFPGTYAMRIMRFEVEDSQILIPARRNSDSVLGMYDIVNNVFRTNAGTGTFTAGPAI